MPESPRRVFFEALESGMSQSAAAAVAGVSHQTGSICANHEMMLDHYQQTKNLMVSYSNKAQGFF